MLDPDGVRGTFGGFLAVISCVTGCGAGFVHSETVGVGGFPSRPVCVVVLCSRRYRDFWTGLTP